MLQHLSIRHFAIIDELELELQPGLNVLSGETGAGKSIILQALGLVIGHRGYADLIRSGEEECEVAAVFDVARLKGVSCYLDGQGYGKGDTLVIRRLLNRAGKGRIWVNDRPSTVGVLQELGRFLVDLVGQHESHYLLSEETPRYLLDSFGGHPDLLERYQEVYQNYLQLKSEYHALEVQLKEAKEKEELFRFQLHEIEGAALKEGEEEELLQERKILSNASKLSEGIHATEALLYSAHDSAIELLGRAVTALTRLGPVDPSLEEQAEKLKLLSEGLEEASRFLQSYLKKINFDPDRLCFLEDRLEEISRLKKKYGESVSKILAKKVELEGKVSLLEDRDVSLQSLQEKIKSCRKFLAEKAGDLTQARKKAALEFSRCLEKELSSLAMEGTRFEIRLDSQDFKTSDFLPDGLDNIHFLISPNKGETLKPLSLIASGGELSRLLLALKSVLKKSAVGHTSIFDEVDTGIGGRVAEVVGQKLKKLAQSSQVICITHLPQIAACADVHFQISKVEQKERILTRVRRLERQEREEEIARMLAGVRLTDKALSHARELIKSMS